ncbi:MAG: hypothetical protein WCO00_08815 [Rhodospirillaceae bacterium]
MKPAPITILQAMADKKLFGGQFSAKTWEPWRGFLSILYGLEPTAEHMALFKSCTGRDTRSHSGSREAWLVCGRRAGKSRILALIAAYEACLRNWRPFLSSGERGVVAVLACDRRQAQVIFGYVKALITETPLLAPLVTNETADTLELSNGISVEVTTADFRRVRGRTIVTALMDEVCFWRSDSSANPDQAVLDALRPAMATVPGSLLLAASSPYAKRGIMYDAWKRWHGNANAPALIWQAPSRTMNPALPERLIIEALERDPAAARAEYLAEWRDDVSAFLDRAVVESAVDLGETVRPPVPGVAYVAFADPSGGSADAFTLGIAHAEGELAVLDCLYERRPPFNPSEVVAEVAEVLKSYHLTSVMGDRYAAQWVVEAFAKVGIAYRHSERDRSAIYSDVLPLFTSGRARLLDNTRLASQFSALERRTSVGGRDRIDHGPNGHDDAANAAAGALVLAATARRTAPIVSPISEPCANYWANGVDTITPWLSTE